MFAISDIVVSIQCLYRDTVCQESLLLLKVTLTFVKKDFFTCCVMYLCKVVQMHYVGNLLLTIGNI